jgi:tetratricopeptide (TPR) repeat protein
VKKETVITAVVFLVVGFLAGYITEAEFNWNAPPPMAASSSPSAGMTTPGTHAAESQNGPAGAAQSGAPAPTEEMKLPEGHPPLEETATIKALEDQAAQNPTDPQPLLGLANLYYNLRQFDRAANWYEKELALDPKNVSARTDLGTAYFNLGRPQDALREYQESLKIDPTHEPTIFNTIIVNLEGTRNLAAARAAWERLYKRNPNYPGLDSLKESLDSRHAAASGASSIR